MIDAVVKLGGRCLEDGAALKDLAREVAALGREGRWVVLVHGGGEALDRHLAARGLSSVKKHGVRCTPPEQIPEIAGLLCGVLNKRLVAGLRREGVKAVGLCGADGGCAIAEPLRFPDFDPGHVGRIAGGDPSLLVQLAARGFVPVLAPIAADERGEIYNVNADSFAAGLARTLAAKRLVLLTDVAGVKDAQGRIAPRLDAAKVEAWIGEGTIRDGMIPKAQAALAAAREAGCEVVIASWSLSGALPRILAGEAVGTTFEAARESAPALP